MVHDSQPYTYNVYNLYMAIHIADSKTCIAVKQLAEITGETQTEAIRVAVSERLNFLERKQSAKTRIKHAMAIVREPLPASTVFMTQEEMDSLLYDEQGLPHGSR